MTSLRPRARIAARLSALFGVLGVAACGTSGRADSSTAPGGSGGEARAAGGAPSLAGTTGAGAGTTNDGLAGQAQSTGGAGAPDAGGGAGVGGASGAVSRGGSPASDGGAQASGRAGSSGAGATAAGRAGQCGLGQTTFVLKPAAGTPDGAFCLDESTARFLSISPRGGAPLNSFMCSTQECDATCEAVFRGCLPGRLLTASGTSTPWLGTSYVTETSTVCGRSCDAAVCVEPGPYTVTMCASLTVDPTASGGGCTGGEQRCVSIDFDVPFTESVITGEISP